MRRLSVLLFVLLVCVGAGRGQIPSYVPSQISDIQGLSQALVGSLYDAQITYGAKHDGRVITDAAMTSGSNVLTASTSAPFVSGDVGKLITVVGAGTSSSTISGTISGYTDSSHVTTSFNAATTVSAKKCIFGTDDSTSIQNAINAASAAGGGIVFLRPGRYCLSTALLWASKVSLQGSGVASSILNPINQVATSAACAITALTGGQTTPFVDCTFRDFEIDATGQGGSTAIVSRKGIYGQYWLRAIFYNLSIHDTGATGLGVDFLADSVVYNVTTYNCGRLATYSSAGSSGIGIGTGATITYSPQPSAESSAVTVYDSGVIMGCHSFSNCRYGIFVESQGAVDRGWRIIGNKTEKNGWAGIGVAGNNHGAIVTGNVSANNGGSATGFSGGPGYGVYIGADTIGPASAPSQWVVSNNSCMNNQTANICIDYRYVSSAAASARIVRGLVQGNVCSNLTGATAGNADGIQIIAGSAYAVSNLDVVDNQIYEIKYNGVKVQSTQVTTSAAASSGATTLSVSALPYALPNGCVLTFISGKTATLTAAAASGATSLTVSALAASISSGDVSVVTIDRLSLRGNKIYNNGTGTSNTYDAISLNNVTFTNLLIDGNECFDNQSTQTQRYGLNLLSGNGSAVTSGRIERNRLSGNLTGGINFGVTPAAGVSVASNAGYNPVGLSSVSVGASPWTYTAGLTQERLYLYGGTVSGVVKGGQTIASATGVVIYLAPNESATVTYSAAPSATAEKL